MGRAERRELADHGWMSNAPIAAGPRKANQELFREFEWMIDELHGCGDALIPRGMDAAIADGYRLGVRI